MIGFTCLMANSYLQQYLIAANFFRILWWWASSVFLCTIRMNEAPHLKVHDAAIVTAVSLLPPIVAHQTQLYYNKIAVLCTHCTHIIIMNVQDMSFLFILFFSLFILILFICFLLRFYFVSESLLLLYYCCWSPSTPYSVYTVYRRCAYILYLSLEN